MAVTLKRQALVSAFFCLFLVMLVGGLVGVAYCPTVEVDVTDDTYLDESNPNTNWSSVQYMYTGRPSVAAYALMNWNVSSLISGYGAGYYQTDHWWIQIYWRCSNPDKLSANFNIYRITTGWNESVNATWNSAPTFVDVLDVTMNKTTPYASYEVGYLNVTDDFIGVLNGTFAFYGYMVYANPFYDAGSPVSGYAYIASKEYPTVDYNATIMNTYTTSGTTESYGFVYGTEMVNFIALFLCIFAPGLFLAQTFDESRILGFVVGASLGTGLGVVAGIVPYYFLLVISIALVLLLVRGRSR